MRLTASRGPDRAKLLLGKRRALTRDEREQERTDGDEQAEEVDDRQLERACLPAGSNPWRRRSRELRFSAAVGREASLIRGISVSWPAQARNAGERTRTSKGASPTGPKPVASTSSATPAGDSRIAPRGLSDAIARAGLRAVPRLVPGGYARKVTPGGQEAG